MCSDEAEANTLKLTNEISKLTETIQLLEQKVVEKDLEIEVLEGEISATREATNQPLSRVMKDQVNRLKQNLIQKDNDIQTLEEALLQVKSELMDITERAVIQEARGAEHQHSLHVSSSLCRLDFVFRILYSLVNIQEYNVTCLCTATITLRNSNV